jgi:hypothetical protein
VVVEGIARRVTSEDRLKQLADAWESKYHGDWHFDVTNGARQGDRGQALLFEVLPTKILGFATGSFARTRYRFERRHPKTGAGRELLSANELVRLAGMH